MQPLRLGWPVSNAWLVRDTDIGHVLIDTGHPTTWAAIRAGLRGAGVAPRSLGAVLLTHRHSDHAGNAARIQRRYGVPVYAHRIDAEVLRQRAPRPRLRLGVNIASSLSWVENAFPAASPDEVRDLEEGQHVAGLQVLLSAGHTSGSICLYHAPTRALFTGDAVLCNPVPPRRGALRLPVRAYCTSYDDALASLRALVSRQLPIEVVYSGHGPPRRGDIASELRALLDLACKL